MMKRLLRTKPEGSKNFLLVLIAAVAISLLLVGCGVPSLFSRGGNKLPMPDVEKVDSTKGKAKPMVFGIGQEEEKKSD